MNKNKFWTVGFPEGLDVWDVDMDIVVNELDIMAGVDDDEPRIYLMVNPNCRSWGDITIGSVCGTIGNKCLMDPDVQICLRMTAAPIFLIVDPLEIEDQHIQVSAMMACMDEEDAKEFSDRVSDVDGSFRPDASKLGDNWSTFESE